MIRTNPCNQPKTIPLRQVKKRPWTRVWTGMWTTCIRFFATFLIKKQIPLFFFESYAAFLGKCNKGVPGVGTDSMLWGQVGIDLFMRRPCLVVQVYIACPQGPQASRLEPPITIRKIRRNNAKAAYSSLHFGNGRHIMWFRMPCHIWWPVVVAVMTISDMGI